MIIDAHCHVFEYGKGWSEKIASLYLEAGLAKTPTWWEPTRNWTAEDQHVDVERLISHMDEAHVDKSVIFGITARPYECYTSLDYVVSIVDQFRDRLVPIHVADPLGGRESRQETKKAITEHGFRGIKLLPVYNHLALDDPILYPFYALAEEHEVPLIVHTGSTRLAHCRLEWQDPTLIDKVGAEFPDLKLWMAHGGMYRWKEAFAVLAKYPNMVADLSFWGRLPRHERASAMTTAKHFGLLPRLLWGTDYPFWGQKGELEMWRDVPKAQRSLSMEPVLSEADLAGFLGGNVARLLALSAN